VFLTVSKNTQNKAGFYRTNKTVFPKRLNSQGLRMAIYTVAPVPTETLWISFPPDLITPDERPPPNKRTGWGACTSRRSPLHQGSPVSPIIQWGYYRNTA